MTRTRPGLSVVFAAVVLLLMQARPGAQGSSAEALYADASAKETAVRKALAGVRPPVTVLRAVRTVVLDYESVVRRYPASPYGDDALWRAALLSSDAFRTFGDLREKIAATKLLQLLATQYPSSKLAKQGPAIIAELSVLPTRASVTFERTTRESIAKPPSVELSAPAAIETSTDAPEAPLSIAPATVTSAARSVEAVARPVETQRGVKAARVAPNEMATITDIRRATLTDVVRVVIELDREVSFRDERLENPSRVFIDLRGTDTTKALRDQTLKFDGDTAPVKQVRLGRHPNNTTRVVLDAGAVSSYSVYSLYNPFRLVIDCLPDSPASASTGTAAVRPAALPPFPAAPRPTILLPLVARRLEPWSRVTPAVAAVNERLIREALSPPEPPPPTPITPAVAASLPTAPAPEPPSRMLAGGFSLARQLGMGVSRIVIDPGHGGHDPGAKGGGSTEASLVLDVALRLEKLFQNSPGMEVVLTRRTDEYLSLQERTAMANREGADLFLSIHANASNTESARGVETYFLNFANNLSAAATAARENAASGQSMGELPDVVKTIALNNKLAESKDLATYVQREMVSRLAASNRPIRDLGVKQAPFQVLIGAAMPSILAEVAFLSNAQESKLVKQPAYRQRIAEALFAAIRKYQNSLTHVSTLAQKP